jgi:hypothetical protein
MTILVLEYMSETYHGRQFAPGSKLMTSCEQLSTANQLRTTIGKVIALKIDVNNLKKRGKNQSLPDHVAIQAMVPL